MLDGNIASNPDKSVPIKLPKVLTISGLDICNLTLGGLNPIPPDENIKFVELGPTSESSDS